MPVAALCLVLQILAATFLPRDPDSPNASTAIARALIERAEFAAYAWPRDARTPSGAEEPLRAYHLPVEPLYLAFGFRWVPAALLKYLHIPFTVLLVTSVAAAGMWTGGRAFGRTAGVIAGLDPFIVAHGSVWDDTFAGAALEWFIFALLLKSLAVDDTKGSTISRNLEIAAIGIAAAMAVLTRSSSQVVLMSVAFLLIGRASYRSLGTRAWTMLACGAIALGAWGARNEAVLGEFHVGSTHDGIALLESNCKTTRAALLRWGTTDSSLEDLQGEYAAVGPMHELDADRYFKHRAVAYAREQPGDVASTAMLKLALSLTGVQPAHPLTSPRNLIALGSNVFLLLVGGAGLCRWWRDSRDRIAVRLLFAICLIVATVTILGLLAGPSGVRYRIGATGFLYLGVAAAFPLGLRRKMLF
jgi:hypothetical protein